jgi:hypothetical protein
MPAYAKRFFYDLEFLEDGRTIDVISIGVVDENGDSYYAVSNEFDVEAVLEHQWLRENVWPHLPQRETLIRGTNWGTVVANHLDLTHLMVKSREQIREELIRFFTERTVGGSAPVELWAWYGAYDHVALMQLWGPMVDKPQMLPMFTHDLRQEYSRLARKGPLPIVPRNENRAEHNALSDAIELRNRFMWLRQNGHLEGW